jgi:hypothetical protein
MNRDRSIPNDCQVTTQREILPESWERDSEFTVWLKVLLHLIQMWLEAPAEETEDRGSNRRSTPCFDGDGLH